MLRVSTCLQIASKRSRVYSAGLLVLARSQSEKFTWRRPLSTWSITNQDIGATLLYQGQRVKFEWQSLHPRCKMLSTCGGMGATASSVCDGTTGGLVRAGRIN